MLAAAAIHTAIVNISECNIRKLYYCYNTCKLVLKSLQLAISYGMLCTCACFCLFVYVFLEKASNAEI